MQKRIGIKSSPPRFLHQRFRIDLPKGCNVTRWGPKPRAKGLLAHGSLVMPFRLRSPPRQIFSLCIRFGFGYYSSMEPTITVKIVLAAVVALAVALYAFVYR